jgi:hypothetical protein
MATREQVQAEVAEIKRFARVAGIKRAALGPVPIIGINKIPMKRAKRPRPLFVLSGNGRLRRLMMNCICLRAR